MRIIVCLCVILLLTGCSIQLGAKGTNVNVAEPTRIFSNATTAPTLAAVSETPLVNPHKQDIPREQQTAIPTESTPAGQRSRHLVMDTIAFQQLPEITIAVQTALLITPVHSSGILSPKQVPAGTRVRVIATDQNGAWLLILYEDLLGWIPVIYAGMGVSTLEIPMISNQLSETCAEFLQVTTMPDEFWTSTEGGSVLVQGMAYRPEPLGSEEPTVVLEGAGRVSTGTSGEALLQPMGELLFFTFAVDGLQAESRVRVHLPFAEQEAFSYQAAVFRNRCSEVPEVIAQVPGENQLYKPDPEAPPVGTFDEQIRAALAEYNSARNLALRNSDERLIREVTTGRMLQKEITTIQSDIETGAYHRQFIYRLDIIEIAQLSSTEASVRIEKTEDRLFFPLGCLAPDDTPPCNRPKNKQNTTRREHYGVIYRMILENNRWKIEYAEPYEL